jgi:hypothetical protein
VKRRFGAEAFDNTRLTLVKDGLVERLKDVEATVEALAAFGAAEAGKLQLSPPRPMVVKDLDGEVLALFSRLVEDPEIARRERRTPKPDLSPIVKQLVCRNVPIQRRPEVSVPILDEPFTADFAFLNGARNLVKSVGLSGREENALEEASTAELITDFSPLLGTAAFKTFESALRTALVGLGRLSSER